MATTGPHANPTVSAGATSVATELPKRIASYGLRSPSRGPCGPSPGLNPGLRPGDGVDLRRERLLGFRLEPTLGLGPTCVVQATGPSQDRFKMLLGPVGELD
jgi:hypothetical protein